MSTITENLSILDQLRKDLATNVSNKGVTADQTEKLSTLVPKVANIPTEGYGGKLQTKTVTPTTESQIITPDRGYDGLSKVSIPSVTHKMIPEIIKDNSRNVGYTIKYDIGLLPYMANYSSLEGLFGAATIVAFDNITATPGSTVILPISIWANNQCNGYQFNITWDAGITCRKIQGAFAVEYDQDPDVPENFPQEAYLVNLRGTAFSDGVVSRMHMQIPNDVTVGTVYNVWARYEVNYDFGMDDAIGYTPLLMIPGTITII